MSLELYRNGSIYSPADPFATAMLVENGTVAWIGTEAAAGALLDSRMTEIDLQGALVTPAFVDSHAHLASLGAKLNGLDLSGVRSADELLAAVAADEGTGLLLGAGWDESGFASGTVPGPEELQRAVGDREVYLARADVHSALVSPKLADRLGLVEGPEYSGALVRGRAHERVRAAVFAFEEATSARNRNSALAHLASTGHGTVVEMAAEHVSGRADLEALLGRSDQEKAATPEVFAYWAELVDSEQQARDLLASFDSTAVVGLGGDLNIDGSIGSRTALLRADYADAPGDRGTAYLDAQRIGAHIAACSLAGIQTSFHVIGDAGLDLALEGFDRAAEKVGLAKVQAGRHRLEHVEMVDDAARERMLGFALTASMQPGFDAAWSGTGGMYEQRLGATRADAMNGIGQFLSTGVPVVIGSDAPVTPVSPWSAVKACLELRDPAARISARAAFMAHTRSGFRALGSPSPFAGQLVNGAEATFAIWDAAELSVQTPDLRVSSWSTDARAGTPMLPVLEDELPQCLRTVRAGTVLFDDMGQGSEEDSYGNSR
ncbi:amidohydrolase [Paeniglutamicibacter gangotriensis]|uniref:Metal-dependent hydrolase n=1 Tax=Paeniglutamicibacter gangotriensis Lz1y TaxID=1276920 RepID=M7MNK5_9MICC|nr:amidohydrolase family protein [Paeniglutamicibacter gangotriensis]EMQ96626.1 metal-dependent hydrolase [Paeniglutamicibacter gangotriensis Lz1y]